MILRIYRARTGAEDRGLLLAHLRDHVYPANVGTPGLRTFQAGIRQGRDGELELLLVSTWADFESVRGTIGLDPRRPTWLMGFGGRLDPVGLDHYELVGEELRGIVPLGGGVLRLLTGRLAPLRGPSFFHFARPIQARHLDAGGLVVSHLGRRIVGQGEEAAYVAVWRDAEAVIAASGSETEPVGQAEWEDYFEEWSFATYEAMARVEPRKGDGAALLLADDDRRYVFATPGAARLLGRSSARLLGRRIEDVTVPTHRDLVEAMWSAFLRDGNQSGPFALVQPDGTSVAVHYQARANTPWRGVHASVLGATGDVDIDEALAQAGLVARYAVASTS